MDTGNHSIQSSSLRHTVSNIDTVLYVTHSPGEEKYICNQ